MPSMTERVYPDEMDSSRPIQGVIREVFLRRYRLARDWLREHFGARKVRILDIACGSGFGSAILGELGTVVGADLDAESVQYAREHYQAVNVDFRTGDAEDRGFLSALGRFDAVVSSGTIEHLADPAAFLLWMRGALNPGGACVLCFPSTLTMDWAAPYHKRDISPRRAQQLFTECGLRVCRDLVEGHRLRMRDLRAEIRANSGLPVPPLRQWILYFLGHPHRLGQRLFQMTVGGGILFQDQEYLLVPSA
jgi:SAM-dependent methyltransferase